MVFKRNSIIRVLISILIILKILKWMGWFFKCKEVNGIVIKVFKLIIKVK